MSDTLYVLSIMVSREEENLLFETTYGLSLTSWKDGENDHVRIDLFVQSRTDLPRMRQRFREGVRLALGEGREMLCREIKKEDWAESWKRFYHAERVTRRLVVKPGWEDWEASPEDRVLDIYTGMTFGTGLHGTTRGCLFFLDALSDDRCHRAVLDIGCGSGVLSVAAAKLGHRRVCAFDVDPEAVSMTERNSLANGVGSIVEVARAVLPDIPLGMSGDLVVVNVLASILSAHCEAIASTVPVGGDLIMGGCLDTQYESVRDQFCLFGVKERDSVLFGEWRTGLFSRLDTVSDSDWRDLS